MSVALRMNLKYNLLSDSGLLPGLVGAPGLARLSTLLYVNQVVLKVLIAPGGQSEGRRSQKMKVPRMDSSIVENVPTPWESIFKLFLTSKRPY